MSFTPADIAYVEQNFVALTARPPGPGPSYVLDDGREFYPKDYREHETDEVSFKARLMQETQQCGVNLDIEQEWQAYLAGL